MSIVPLNGDKTLEISIPTVTDIDPKSKVIADPLDEMPNGIYRVVKWENVRMLFVIVFSLLVLFASTTLLLLDIYAWDTSWVAYLIPTPFILFSFLYLLMTLFDFRNLKKSIEIYRRDLKMGLTSTPPFVVKIYRSLIVKQIRHNWISFFLILHIGITTILLWWLKDTSWWIFEFDKWIHKLFKDPTMMSWIFTISLILVAVYLIVMTIQRKRRMVEMDAYFGVNIISPGEVESIKESKNKTYRRLFVIYLMILIIIPFVVKLVLRILKLKK